MPTTRRGVRSPDRGAWWHGADRLRIVHETRDAGAMQGENASDGGLLPIGVEAIHGIRNDSGRLARRWFDHLIDMGLQPEAYVELVAVAESSVIVDTFARASAWYCRNRQETEPGEPTFTYLRALTTSSTPGCT